MSWKTLVKSVAPVIGSALGGPVGGVALKAISDKLFPGEKLEGKALEKKIAEAINTDPDALLKLKQADQAFEARLKELDIDLEKIHADDRDSARDLAKNTTLLPQTIIAAIFISGFVLVLYAVFSGHVEMTADQSRIAMYLLGILSAGIMQIMNFFYGSSSGSKDKTAALSANQNGPGHVR